MTVIETWMAAAAIVAGARSGCQQVRDDRIVLRLLGTLRSPPAVTLGGAGMAVAGGIVTFPVPLIEERGKLLRKPARALTAAGVAEPVLVAVAIVNDVLALDEILERGTDDVG